MNDEKLSELEQSFSTSKIKAGKNFFDGQENVIVVNIFDVTKCDRSRSFSD